MNKKEDTYDAFENECLNLGACIGFEKFPILLSNLEKWNKKSFKTLLFFQLQNHTRQQVCRKTILFVTIFLKAILFIFNIKFFFSEPDFLFQKAVTKIPIAYHEHSWKIMMIQF